MNKFITSLMCALSLLGSVQTWAWGPLGHKVIGTAAARLTDGNLKNLMFHKVGEGVDRSIQVGYFADYPDSGWKGLGPITHRYEIVTHIFQVDDLGEGPIPSDYDQAKALFQGKKGKSSGRTIDFFSTIGSAPWRAEQFRKMMSSELQTAGRVLGQGNKKSALEHAREAVIFGSLMGHYIGDLSQPLHVAIDYNGWAHNQGGLHHYFEGELVSAIAPKTLEMAVRKRAAEIYPAVLKIATQLKDPVQVLIYLARNSSNMEAALLKMDRQYSLLQPSKVDPDGKRHNAKRRPGDEVIDKFAPLIVDRLAMAAAVLKVFWTSAFAAAGEPDLSALDLASLPFDHGYVKPNYDKFAAGIAVGQ